MAVRVCDFGASTVTTDLHMLMIYGKSVAISHKTKQAVMAKTLAPAYADNPKRYRL